MKLVAGATGERFSVTDFDGSYEGELRAQMDNDRKVRQKMVVSEYMRNTQFLENLLSKSMQTQNLELSAQNGELVLEPSSTVDLRTPKSFSDVLARTRMGRAAPQPMSKILNGRFALQQIALQNATAQVDAMNGSIGKNSIEWATLQENNSHLDYKPVYMHGLYTAIAYVNSRLGQTYEKHHWINEKNDSLKVLFAKCVANEIMLSQTKQPSRLRTTKYATEMLLLDREATIQSIARIVLGVDMGAMDASTLRYRMRNNPSSLFLMP